MQAIKFVKFLRVFLLSSVSIILCACGEKSPAEIERISQRKSELAVRRAQVMTSEGKIQDAIAMLEKAYQECGARTNICEALANAFVSNGQTASAGIFYEQAFDCDNSRVELLIFAANAYEQTGSLDAAISAYEKFLKKMPNNSTAIKSLAKIYEKQGNFDKALNSYLGAIKIDNRNPDTSEAAAIGSLFAKLGNMTQAKLWLESALKVTLPENIATRKEIYLGLIDVYLAKKDMENLEKTILALDSIDKKIINEKHPTLKAKLAEFKHQLAEVEAQLNAEKHRSEIEKEQAIAEAEKAKQEQEAKLQALEQEKGKQKKQSDEEKQSTTSGMAVEKPVEKKEEVSKPQEEVKSENVEKPSKENKETADVSEKSEKSKQVETLSETPASDVQEERSQTTVVEQKKEEETELQLYIRKTLEAIETKDKKKALVYANNAIEENPRSEEAWQVMTQAFILNNLFDDAYLAANEAYLLNRDSLKNALLVLESAQNDKNREKILQIAQLLQEKFANSSDVAFYLAKAYEASSNKQQAKVFYQKALNLGLKDEKKIEKANSFLKQ